MGDGSRTDISAPDLIDLRGKLLLAPDIWLVNRFVVPVAWRPPSLVFGVELAGLLDDPTASVGMIGWLIGGAMYLTWTIKNARLDEPKLFLLNGFFRWPDLEPLNPALTVVSSLL